MPNAHCPTPNPQCLMPNAQCPMPPGAAVLMGLLYLSLLPTPLATASDGLAAHLQVVHAHVHVHAHAHVCCEGPSIAEPCSVLVV